jgi:hypothetical protein
MLCSLDIVHSSHQTAVADRCNTRREKMIEAIKHAAFVAISGAITLGIAVGMAVAMNPATWR